MIITLIPDEEIDIANHNRLWTLNLFRVFIHLKNAKGVIVLVNKIALPASTWDGKFWKRDSATIF